MHITAAEQTHYHRHGYFTRTSQFTPAELDDLRSAVQRIQARIDDLARNGTTYVLDGKRFVDSNGTTIQFEHETGSQTLRVIEPAHLHDARIEALIDDERLVLPMQALVGTPELALWTVKLNIKSPRHGSGFGWHQDSPYWMHDCDHVDQLPNVMLLLDEQTENNGCFRIIPGSHAHGILPGTNDGTQLGGFFTDPQCFDAATAHAMVLPAGSLVFFDPHVIHGSQPNNSDQPRRALIFTYQPGGYATLKLGDHRPVRTTPT